MPKNFKEASPGPSKGGVKGKFSYVDNQGIEPRFFQTPALSCLFSNFCERAAFSGFQYPF